MKNSDKPINPVYSGSQLLREEAFTEYYEKRNHIIGLTKREHFAALAMQGLMSCVNHYPDIPKGNEHTAKLTAEFAIAVADELLKQLEIGPALRKKK